MKRIVCPMLGPGIIVLVWFVISSLRIFSPILFPSLAEVACGIGHILLQGSSYAHMGATVMNAFFGCLIAVIVGIVGGLILGWNREIYTMRKSTLHFFRTLPATALFPVFLLFFGINNEAKVGIAAFVTLWIVMIATIEGVHQGSQSRYETAKLLGIHAFSLFRYVLFFEALPSIMIGVKTALSMSLIVVIVVEVFVGSQFGIGQQIYDSYISYNTSILYARIFCIGMIGVVVNVLFDFVQKKILYR